MANILFFIIMPRDLITAGLVYNPAILLLLLSKVTKFNIRNAIVKDILLSVIEWVMRWLLDF